MLKVLKIVMMGKRSGVMILNSLLSNLILWEKRRKIVTLITHMVILKPPKRKRNFEFSTQAWTASNSISKKAAWIKPKSKIF